MGLIHVKRNTSRSFVALLRGSWWPTEISDKHSAGNYVSSCICTMASATTQGCFLFFGFFLFSFG